MGTQPPTPTPDESPLEGSKDQSIYTQARADWCDYYGRSISVTGSALLKDTEQRPYYASFDSPSLHDRNIETT